MSDRYIALTVLLEKPMRDEDVERIVTAITLLRGVLEVTPIMQDPQTLWARQTARHELGEQLMKILYPDPAK